jgi:acyl dehydratase
MLHLEDFAPGDAFDLGRWTFSQDEIVEFGLWCDPLDLHTDPEAAAAGPFGGLIASGRHSCVAFARLLWDGLLSGTATLGPVGADEVRWRTPVRPGDTLTARATVAEVLADGVVVLEGELLNEAGEVSTTLRLRERVAARA